MCTCTLNTLIYRSTFLCPYAVPDKILSFMFLFSLCMYLHQDTIPSKRKSAVDNKRINGFFGLNRVPMFVFFSVLFSHPPKLSVCVCSYFFIYIYSRHEVPVTSQPITIVYMDDDIVVVNKPASIPVSGLSDCHYFFMYTVHFLHLFYIKVFFFARQRCCCCVRYHLSVLYSCIFLYK